MSISLAFEVVVSLLLVITVFYCFVLDRRLRALRSGQDGVRQSITDLVEATLRAEQGIHNLNASAEKVGAELESRIVEAKTLSKALAKPTSIGSIGSKTARKGQPPAKPEPRIETSNTTQGVSGLMDRLKRAG